MTLTFQEKVEKARRLMEKHGLKDWRLSIENLENPDMFHYSDGKPFDGGMGLCVIKEQTIYIHSGLPDRHFRQTLLHEIAHALTPNDPGHGREWIIKAGEIGCTFTHVFPYCLRARDDEKRASGKAVTA